MTYIVYIPGLGDHYGRFRSLSLATWRLWGVTTKHQAITWYDGGSMASKMQLIKTAIDEAPKGAFIVLIGESAGATLALHAASSDKRVGRVITLCGVARPDTPVSATLRRRAPALDEAVITLPYTFSVDVHSVRAKIDGVVGRRYSSTTGATRHVIWTIGHFTTIALCLTVLAPYISAIAKKPKK